MPHVIEKTAFFFSELNDSAKEKAREWYRTNNLDYDWWDYDDFVRMGAILGIEINQDKKKGQ